MGHKATETTHNINNMFGPRTANELTVQRWLKKFCKADQSLEDEECSGQPLEVDSDQLRGSLKLTLLQLHAAAAAAKSLQSCPTLSDPHRCQPTRLSRPWDSPGKNTGVGCHFLLQCMKVKSDSEVAQSCPTLSNPMTATYQAPLPMGFSRQEYWSGMPFPSPMHESEK